MPYRAPIAGTARIATSDRDRQRARRESGLGRLYDSPQWRRRTRPHVLGRDPFCKLAVVCDGGAVSTDVDHVIDADDYVAQHNGDARYFYDVKNLRGICHACHSHKTARERAGTWIEPTSRPQGGSVLAGGGADDRTST